MRSIRNSRYVEFLERKLSPSGPGLIPVTAEVRVTPLVAAVDEPPTLPPYDPFPQAPRGLPPLPLPVPPGGPSDPCLV